MARRILPLLLLFATSALGQQSSPTQAVRPASITEPDLPVVNEKVCPFEGCTFREWNVEKDSTVYSTWKDAREQIGLLKAGEKVQGLTGVFITRQPDRFLVTEPIPALSLKAGDIVLEYGEWGEGYADIWMAGQWLKDYNFDGQVAFTEENLKLVRHGVKEWWVQVKRADGLTGWVHVDGNFGNMDQLGDAPEDSPSTSDATADRNPPKTLNLPEPNDPVVHEDPCPGKGRVIARWPIRNEEPYYAFQGGAERVQLGTLWVGQQVNVLDGLEVILKPDRLLVTKPIGDLGLQADEVILRYGRYRKGQSSLWFQGEWHESNALATVEKDGSGCKSECNSVVFQKGVVERWVEIVTSTNQTGWMLVSRSTNEDFWDSGNFDNLCSQ